MKKLYTCLVLLFSITLSAQLTIDPIVLEFSIDANEESFTYQIYIENTSNFTVDFYWMFEPGDDFKESWLMYIADLNIQYIPGVYKCADSKPISLEPKEKAELILTFKPNGVEGTSPIKLYLFDEPGCVDLITRTRDGGFIQVGGGTSVDEIYQAKSMAYPNPFYSNIIISNDEKVEEILIVDVLGQLVYTSKHSKSMHHDLSVLPLGNYIITYKHFDGSIHTHQLIKQE